MKLTVNNETDYSTAAIRSAVLASCKFWGLKRDRVIDVQYSRGRRRGGPLARGNAHYPFDRRKWPMTEKYGGASEGTHVNLWLPRPVDGAMPKYTPVIIFWLIHHELAHNAGVSHPNMGTDTPLRRVWTAKEFPNWAPQDWTIPVRADKPAPTRQDRVEKRAAKVQALYEKWQRKLALAKTKVAKLKARVAYYERRAAQPAPAATPPPREPRVRPPKRQEGIVDAEGLVWFKVPKALDDDFAYGTMDSTLDSPDGTCGFAEMDYVARDLKATRKVQGNGTWYALKPDLFRVLYKNLYWATNNPTKAFNNFEDKMGRFFVALFPGEQP